jgi:hypothetical protein
MKIKIFKIPKKGNNIDLIHLEIGRAPFKENNSSNINLSKIF